MQGERYPGLGLGAGVGGGPPESATWPVSARERSREKENSPFPDHSARPISSSIPRPGRVEPRLLQLLPAALVALVQRMLLGNCRTSDRVCRRAFKWKLPVIGREGARFALCRRPCCTASRAGDHAFGSCHAVRQVRTEATAGACRLRVSEAPGLGGGGEWCTLPA